jgi:uncharacterized LabA/DUF88 family protein
MRYLFIDGEYFEIAYRDLMKRYFGDDGDINLPEVVRHISADRVYYYHALEDELRPKETPLEMDARIDQDKQRFDAIQALPDFHVRLGKVSGKALKRRRQKQVDVQLAVDMLTHGFGQNMSHAILLAGDLDFLPVIETLVRLGVKTHVWYEPRSAAKPLYEGADVGHAIRARDVHQWSTDEYKGAHPLPNIVRNSESLPPGLFEMQQGTLSARPISLYYSPTTTEYIVFGPQHATESSMMVRYKNLLTLDEFLKDIFEKKIIWSGARLTPP